jgi:hypothetical protein
MSGDLNFTMGVRAWFKNHDFWVSVRTLSAAAQVDEFGNLSRD